MQYKNGPVQIAALIIGLFLILTPSHSRAQQASPDDTARFLAGFHPSDRSPLAAFSAERSWRDHTKQLGSAWRRLDKRHISKVRAWSKRNLKNPNPHMLYLFSGPDFLHADVFYPHASTYVLSGLEPVGRMPDLVAMSRHTRAGALYRLRVSLNFLLRRKYFVTSRMQENLHSRALGGTLPIIYVFLARAGKTIESVEFINLNPDGSITPRIGRRTRGSASGVKIIFSEAAKASGERRRQKTLYYFRTDLSDKGMKRSGFEKFVTAFGPADSLLKSASYLLHNREFTMARKLVLGLSAHIVQDDTGVPARFFSKDEWQLYPFGRYIRPHVKEFVTLYQSAMRKLFARGRTQPIDFIIGYRHSIYATNLLLAIKKPR